MNLPSDAIGSVAVFHHVDDVVLCKVKKDAPQLVGSVIDAKALPPTKRGAIPTCLLLVKGRTGRELWIDLVENHVRLFPTWAEAMEAIK